jgi:diguanylate cyclase (GGDEF)-like protein/PAS domain S-box-containing protein
MPPGPAFWGRAELTIVAVTSALAGWHSLAGTGGRNRSVRAWLSLAISLWLLGELLRNVEVALGVVSAPALSDLPVVGLLACAAGAYVAALKGRLRPREELTVYLDGAILFFATAAVMLTTFGEVAARSPRAAMDLTYATFFLATTGAALILDFATRAERRPRGAYVVLLGLVLLGADFVRRLAAAETPLAGQVPVHLAALGVFAVMLGTITWSDAVDQDPGYTRLAARLRSAFPIVAVALMPPLVAIAVTRPMAGVVGMLTAAAIGLVLATVAIRQSVLLRDREDAVERQRQLGTELASAEVKYRSLVERQPGVVYVAEPGPTGRWTYVSPQVEAMLGFPAQAWIDDPELWARQIHPEDRDRVLRDESLPVGERTAETTKREYRLLAADGRVVWVLDDETLGGSGQDGGSALVQGVLLDITERKLAERALQASEEQQRLIIETASYAFLGMDVDGRVVDWNHHATETFGWSRDEAMGRSVADLIIPDAQREAHHAGLRHYLATGEGPILSKRIEVMARHRDGREFPVELTVWPVHTAGEVRFSALIDDISTRRQLEDQLREQALHDPLTTLANRVLFVDRVRHAFEQPELEDRPAAAVLAVGLDEFRAINDSLGHAAGDELLMAVGTRLRLTARPEDTTARLGGDQFAILIEQPLPGDAEDLATRVLATLNRPFDIDGHAVSVHASVGIAISGEHGIAAEDLVRSADLAMYRAKARGRNRYERYETGMHEQTLQRLALRSRLHDAVAAEQLEVHYQPIVALADGAIVGFEALLRWRDEDGGYVPPTDLIPIAEETGLILPIGRFVLERACREAATWQAADEGASLDIAVNVSAVQLDDSTFIDDLDHALSLTGLDPGSLILEITESALSSDSLSTIRTIREIRARGVRTALDDFGTGYSSMGRLRRFPVDMVKIDRGFVAAMAEERDAALVQSIIDLGRTLSMAVVAEGIETEPQLMALRERGATLGQGFYFSKAVPPEAIGPLLVVGRLPLPKRRPRAVSRRA